jgi:outer membrane protein
MTMKKRRAIGLIPGLLLLGYLGRAQDKWDLRRCVEFAVTNNISIKQSDVQARLAALTVKQGQLEHIPTLNLGAGVGVNSGHNLDPATYNLSTLTYTANSYSLTSSVVLFNFLGLKNAIDASRYAWQAQLANSDYLKNNISLNVANAYLQVLLTMEQANTAAGQLKLSQTQLGTTRKQVVAGALPELNAAELESQVAQDSANYVGANTSIEQAVLTLKAYMGLDAAVPFVVDTPPVDLIPVDKLSDLQPESVYALALTNQPLQRMDALLVQSGQSTVKANRSQMYPTVSLSGSLASNYISSYKQGVLTPYTFVDTIGTVVGSGNKVITNVTGYNTAVQNINYFSELNQNFSQSIGINLNIPIFSQGALRINFEKAKLNLRNTELQRDQDNLNLKENIYQAYTAAMAALQKFEANKISVTTTQKSFEYAQKRYNVGMLNTIDLLTQENNYFNAKITLVTSHYDYVFKMKVLEFYKGMGIKL